MNLQVKHNSLVNKLKMQQYKLSQLKFYNFIEKRKTEQEIERLKSDIDFVKELREIQRMKISENV